MTDIRTNLERLRQEIHDIALACSRDPQAIQLLAVSKTFPKQAILEAYASGQRRFGENYVQEGVEKIQDLKDLCPGIEWHFIGPLQSNKTKDVAEHFDWMHSVDRLKIAKRLDEQRPAQLPPLQVCVQVNISQESSKSGIDPKDVVGLCQEISNLPRLQLRGLMSIPEPTGDPLKQKRDHHLLRELWLQIKSQLNPTTSANFDTLSMGMSNDMRSAIEEGSTMVRIGTAIFGQRTYL